MKGLLSPCAAVFVAVAPALADPVFTPAQTALPAAHIYAGGWEHFVGGGVAIFDCNGDARPDFYAAGGENEAALFVQNAQGPFGFALGQGIAPLRGVTGAYPIDIDSDGHVDLAVLRVGENRLLRGHGDCRFTDATEDWGFAVDDRWSTAFSATWEPGMRWPTLAVGNYVDRADPEGPFEACDSNQLYRPSGAGFAPPLELTPAFCALSMLFSDWTRSGAAELRISNDRHYYVRGGYEQMWRMDPLHERGQADGWSRVSLWGMGIASADLARDGYPDVMLTSMGDQVLHLNEAGDIVPAGYGSGTTAHRPHTGDDGRPSTGWHAEFADVDNDGLADLFIAKGNMDQMPGSAMKDPNSLLMQQTDGTFKEVAAAAGVASFARARGAGLADFNQDGRLDLVVVNRRAPLEIWLNTSDQTGHWASVDLKSEGANRFAIGGWLEIARDGGASEWRERTIGGGHVSGSALPFHIGLWSAARARVRVWWPDGSTGAWQEVDAGQRITITRP